MTVREDGATRGRVAWVLLVLVLVPGAGPGCAADGSPSAGADADAQAEGGSDADASPDSAAETAADPPVAEAVLDTVAETAGEPGWDGDDDTAAEIVPETVEESAADAEGTEAAPDVPQACAPTQADAQGPYYLPGAPFTPQIAGPEEPGQRLRLSGQVLGPACAPVPGALLDVWQADASGAYPGADEGFRLRGRLTAGADGAYAFETVLPGFYEDRPRHLHLKVSAQGFAPLTTQLYFAGDPFLWPEDSCGPPTCHSDDPARILALQEAVEDGQTVLLGRVDLVLATAGGP
jgi:catechol 1,2-dioxygenase